MFFVLGNALKCKARVKTNWVQKISVNYLLDIKIVI